jgi:hypothetical protein
MSELDGSRLVQVFHRQVQEVVFFNLLGSRLTLSQREFKNERRRIKRGAEKYLELEWLNRWLMRRKPRYFLGWIYSATVHLRDGANVLRQYLMELHAAGPVRHGDRVHILAGPEREGQTWSIEIYEQSGILHMYSAEEEARKFMSVERALKLKKKVTHEQLMTQIKRLSVNVNTLIQPRSPAKSTAVESSIMTRPNTPSRFLFREVGEDYWEVAYESAVLTPIKNLKGMRIIAYLLAHPDKDVSLSELWQHVNPSQGGVTARAKTLMDQAAIPISDIEELRLIREELLELDQGIERARKGGDEGEVARKEHERTDLLRHFRAVTAVRQHGRKSRMFNDTAERLRKALSKAYNVALDKIEHVCPPLARHLGCIRVGYTCSYKPDHPIPWILQ